MEFIIDTRNLDENSEKATYEFYLDEKIYIKDINLKSISFYNSWWTGDFLPAAVFPFLFINEEIVIKAKETKYRPHSEAEIKVCLENKLSILMRIKPWLVLNEMSRDIVLTSIQIHIKKTCHKSVN